MFMSIAPRLGLDISGFPSGSFLPLEIVRVGHERTSLLRRREISTANENSVTRAGFRQPAKYEASERQTASEAGRTGNWDCRAESHLW